MSKGKRITRYVAAALFAACAAAVLLLSTVTLDLTGFAQRFSSVAQQKWGLKTEFTGIHLKCLPEPTMTLTGLTASGGGVASSSARSVRLRAALLPLLAGRTVIRSVDAEGVSLTVAASAIEGLGKTQHGTAPDINEINLNDLKIRIIDDGRPAGRTLEADVRRAYLYESGDARVFKVEGRTKDGARFATSGNWNMTSHTLTGTADVNEIALDRLNRYLGKSAGLKGSANAAISYSYSTDAKTVLNGSVSIAGAEARLPGILAAPLRVDGRARLSATLVDGRYSVALDEIKMETDGFTLSGKVIAEGRGADGTLSLAISTTPIPLSALKRFMSANVMPAQAASLIAGVAPLGGTATFDEITLTAPFKGWRPDAKKAAGSLAAKTRLDKLAFRYAGLSEPFRNVSGEITFADMSVKAHNLEAGYGGIRLRNLNGEVAGLRTNPRYDLSLIGIFDARECRRLARELGGRTESLLAKLGGTSLSGDVFLSLNIKGTLGNGGPTQYAGVARFREIMVSSPVARLALGPVMGSASFDNEMITVNQLSGAYGESSFSLSGLVNGYATASPSFEINGSGTLTNETISEFWSRAPALDGKLNVNARASGTTESFLAGASFNTGTGAGEERKTIRLSGAEITAADIRIHGNEPAEIGSFTMKIRDGSLRGHRFKDLNVSAAAKKTTADASVGLTIDGGMVTGGLTLYRTPGAPRVFDAAITLAEVKVDEMLQAFGAKNKILSGGLSGRITLSATAGRKDLVSGLSGEANLVVEKGRLHKFLVMSKIFSVINIISIDELFKDGLPYKTLAGVFKMTDGVIATDNLNFDSDSMRMSAIGKIDLNGPEIESYLALRPFVTIDNIVSRVPLAGWIITGKEKTIVSLYYEIAGPLGNPEVSPAPVKGISEGIPGILERLITLPSEAISGSKGE